MSGKRAVQLMSLVIVAFAFMASAGSAATFNVGPGQAYANIGDVPWESIAPGDTVNIYYRATPYKEKFCIAVAGTPAAPVLIHGVPGPGGELPVIDGENATTRLALSYYNDERCVIKVGGGAIPPDIVTKYITFENLDIRGARPPFTYTCDEGTVKSYLMNAASFYVCYGENITVRNCILHNNGNGFFVASSDDPASRSILLEGCYVYDNGNDGSLYEHNSYCAAVGITYQYNHYGPLRLNCSGNNLKDRSSNMIVRYNWIEQGNRQLDLINGEDSILIRQDPLYLKSWVYGNILVEGMSGNRQMVHYGGDTGGARDYRNGTLYFYNNTCVSTRTDRNTLFRLSGIAPCTADFRNSIYETVTTSLNEINAADGRKGAVRMSHCWLNTGWTKGGGTLIDDGTSIVGGAPGFVNQAGGDYHLAAGSPCINAGGPLHADCAAYPVSEQYVVHQGHQARPVNGAIDIGAFEY